MDRTDRDRARRTNLAALCIGSTVEFGFVQQDGRMDGRTFTALAEITTGNPHWLNAFMFAIAAVIAIVLTWWFFGNDG